MNTDKLSKNIARAIFECGDDLTKTTRIQFMSKQSGEPERHQGGLCEVSLAKVIKDVLDIPPLELLPCPSCSGEAKYVEGTDSQADAIYCMECPLGVEHSRMSYIDLKTIWNGLPRNK